jgi:tetratricopeptide (TPR) repeat protein
VAEVCQNCGSLNPSEKQNCRICGQLLRKEGSKTDFTAPPVVKLQKEDLSSSLKQERTELIQLENFSDLQNQKEKKTKELSGFLEKEVFPKTEIQKKHPNQIKEKTEKKDFFEHNSKSSTGGGSIKINEKLKKKNAKIFSLLSGFLIGAIVFVLIFSLFPPEEKDGKIFGLVMNQNKDFLPQVLVTIKELNKKIKANSAGFFLFEKIPQGIYTLEVSSDGYQPFAERVTVKNKSTTTLPLTVISKDVLSLNQTESPFLEENQKNKLSFETEEFGGLKVESNVPEVLVFFDSELLGSGNKIYENLPAGKHTLRLRKEGYADWLNRITIKNNTITKLKIELSPSFASAENPQEILEKGKKELEEKNFAGAIENFNRAISLNPQSAFCFLYRGKAYMELGEKRKGFQDFFEAAKLFEGQNDFPNAIECYDFLIEADPSNSFIHYQRGWDFLQLKKYEESISDLGKAIQLDPDFYPGYLSLGDAHYQNKDYKEAVKNYLLVRDLNPNNKEVYERLTEAFFALKDKEKTKKSYEKFVELSSFIDRETKKQNPEWRKILDYLGVKSQPEF